MWLFELAVHGWERFCCCLSYASLLNLETSTYHVVACPHFHLNLTASLALCSCVVRLKGGYRALQVTAFLFVPVPPPPSLLAWANFSVTGRHGIQNDLALSVTRELNLLYTLAEKCVCDWTHTNKQNAATHCHVCYSCCSQDIKITQTHQVCMFFITLIFFFFFSPFYIF